MSSERTRFAFLRASAARSISALVRALFPCLPTSRFFYGRASFASSLCASRTSRSLVSIYAHSTGPPKVLFFLSQAVRRLKVSFSVSSFDAYLQHDLMTVSSTVVFLIFTIFVS